MNRQQLCVREFQRRFGQPCPDRVVGLESYRGGLRVQLLREEVEEFALGWERRSMAEMIDAITDILYVAYGAAVEMGIDIDPFWEEVHRTNMLKEVGLLRSDGKIVKPEGWKPPEIQRILDEQILTEY